MQIKQSKKSNLFLGFTMFMLVLVSLALVGYGAGQKKLIPKKKLIMAKPDLQVVSFTAKRTGLTTSRAHKIQLKVQVKNVAKIRRCDGPFKIHFQRKITPKGRYRYLGQAGITSLCANPASRKLDLQTRTFNTTVPSGKTYYFKAIIDPLNQVKETKEGNNLAYTDYRARPMISKPDGMRAQARVSDRIPPCEGIDLIITNVEITRNSSGAPFLRATIKNLCNGSCTGAIKIEIDESDALGRPGGIEQQIGVGIGSKEEYRMASALGVANDSSRDCVYILTVSASGGCEETEARKANNTYRVTVPRR